MDVYNKSKLAFHEEKIRALAKGEISAPIYVRIKPTNRCNHHCFYCSYAPGSDCPVSETINPRDEIPREKMLEVLADFRDIGVKAVTFSGGGEPLMHPYIEEFFRKTLDYGIELSAITNGQNLSGDIARLLSQSEWVRASIDSCDAETFHKSRRVPKKLFGRLTQNLAFFSGMKKRDCELGINFIVHELNTKQVFQAARFFKEFGANHIKFTPRYIRDYQKFLDYHSQTKANVEEQIAKARAELTDPSFSVYDTYHVDFSLSAYPERNYSRCYIMQTVPVIGADSVLYACHDKTYTRNGAIGDIRLVPFKTLWFDEETAKRFREFNIKERCRHHCTYDTTNLNAAKMISDIEHLGKYKPPTERHKNFI